MIARLPRLARRTGRFSIASALFSLTAFPGMQASAGELMPFEVPEEPIPWEELRFEDMAPPTSSPIDIPKDTGPDWQPPPLDAYIDTSFSDADFDAFGYPDTQGGYRLVVGFILVGVGGEGLTIAPEVAYTRIGRSEREDKSSDLSTDMRYLVTRTDVHTLDLSSLDFGARAAWPATPLLSLFARAGLQVYHTADKVRTTLDFTPLPASGAPPQASQSQQPSSTADSRSNVYGGLGIALKLGKVPSLYGEYALRRLNGESIPQMSVGVLMNF